MKSTILVSIFSIVFLMTKVSAQLVEITGTVIDALSEEPLIGANVFLQSNLSGGVITDIEGRFSLSRNKLNDTLYISYIGFQTLRLSIAEGVSKLGSVRLRPDVVMFKEIELKASRIIAEEFNVKEIGQMDIYTNPSSKADALIAVQSLPASTSADETANISLRGSPPGETGVFLNNVPIADAVRLDQANGVGQFSIFNTALIKSVNVFPSNPPIELGHATSGAVVLNTSDNVPYPINTLNINLAGAGYFGAYRFSEKSGVTFYINGGSHHGLKALNQSAFSFLNSTSSIDAGVQFLIKPSDKSFIKIFNYTLFENYSYSVQQPSYAGHYFQKKKRNLTIANYNRQWASSQFEINAMHDWSESDFNFGNLSLQPIGQKVYGSINYRLFKTSYSLTAGASIDYVNTDFNGVFPRYDYALAPHHPNDSYVESSTAKSPELYLYGKYNWESLTLGGGFRYRPNTFGINQWLTYQANLLWKINQDNKLQFSAGRYNKLNLSEQNIQITQPIQSDHIALDYHYTKKRFNLTTAFYHKWGSFTDIRHRIVGGELFLEYDYNKIRSSISFSHIKSEVIDGEEKKPSPYDFDYFVRWIGKYGNPDWFDVGFVMSYRQGRAFRSLNNVQYDPVIGEWNPTFGGIDDNRRLPAYFILDVSLSRAIPLSSGMIIAYLGINNVFNTGNVRSINFNRDYSQTFNDFYGRRVLFFGGTWSF